MAAEGALTPTSYINHHLQYLAEPIGPGGFWTLHLDSVLTSVITGVIGLGFLWWVVRGATSGVPGRRQAFVELCFEFVDDAAKSMFHGDRDRFLAPAAMTVFVWVLMMNAMSFLPIDITTRAIHAVGPSEYRLVPTADVNTTFALALTIWLLSIVFAVKAKGLGGWLHEIFCQPFGKNIVLWIPNFLFNLVEYVSKPLSHSLRLFGNMYAAEVIFLLVWLWAATGLTGTIFGGLLGLGWAIFHILIVPLQAYIFMMMTIVYLAMAHESH
jgi:F-type H+-transporting ATPase subunit a